jgi:hypothetical protein
LGTGAVALTATAGDERRATEAVMLARLGYVLYWLGCGLAAVFLVFGVGGTYVAYSTTTGKDPWSWVAVALSCVVLAAVCWVVGRACKYILAGK